MSRPASELVRDLVAAADELEMAAVEASRAQERLRVARVRVRLVTGELAMLVPNPVPGPPNPPVDPLRPRMVA